MVWEYIAIFKDDPDHFDYHLSQLIDLAFEVSQIESPDVSLQCNSRVGNEVVDVNTKRTVTSGYCWELDLKAQRYWNGISSVRMWNGVIIDENAGLDEYEQEIEELDDWANPDGRDSAASDVFRYQQFGNDIGHRDSWIADQPEKFRKLIKLVKRIGSLDELSKIGSLVHNGRIKLTGEQALVFWGKKGLKDGAYWSRKRALESLEKSKIGSFAEKAIKRIEEIKTIPQLKFAAAKLYEVRDGKLVVASPPTAFGWKAIWNTWHRRLKDLLPQVER
jgi:hypothetical protein